MQWQPTTKSSRHLLGTVGGQSIAILLREEEEKSSRLKKAR